MIKVIRRLKLREKIMKKFELRNNLKQLIETREEIAGRTYYDISKTDFEQTAKGSDGQSHWFEYVTPSDAVLRLNIDNTGKHSLKISMKEFDYEFVPLELDVCIGGGYAAKIGDELVSFDCNGEVIL